MGITVSDQERADRIRQLLPTAFVGGTFVGNDQYAAQVQERANMSVPEFEDLVGQSLIEEKFRDLVTDGITVSPSEIEQEFRLRERIRKALETGVGIGLRPPGAIPVPDSHTQQQTPASGSADFVALQTMSLVAGAGLAVFSLNQHITK